MVPLAEPGNEEPGVTELPVTVIVKFEETAVPPFVLLTVLTTVSFGWISEFVMLQVALCPTPSVIWVPVCVPPVQTHGPAA